MKAYLSIKINIDAYVYISITFYYAQMLALISP